MSGILGVENRTENCRTRAISCPSWSLGRMGISIRFSVSSVSRLFFKFLISNPFYPIRIFVRTIYIYGYLVPTASIPLSWFRTILFRLLFSLMIIRSSSPRCVYGKVVAMRAKIRHEYSSLTVNRCVCKCRELLSPLDNLNSALRPGPAAKKIAYSESLSSRVWWIKSECAWSIHSLNASDPSLSSKTNNPFSGGPSEV